AEFTKMNAVADAERISKTGLAEAEKIMAVGRSTADAYELQVKAMGEENFTRFKITEEIAKGKIKIIPDLIVSGGGGDATEGSLSGLMGMQLLQMIQQGKGEKPAKLEPKE
ncbi:MAG: flotillin family protein, partial [Fimbriimonadaceae bacterium]